jgi:hypothetical protein
MCISFFTTEKQHTKCKKLMFNILANMGQSPYIFEEHPKDNKVRKLFSHKI